MRQKHEDLTGKKFGKLSVMSLYNEFYTDGGRLKRQWMCRCSCGREIIVDSENLRRGRRTYCGECVAPPWADAFHRLCRKCEWSEWDAERNDWECTHGYVSAVAKNKCDGYWCCAVDKISGVKHRKGQCLICGKPVYSRQGDTPIYCYEHREQSIRDEQILDEAPKELLFCLIQGIFERAREDYLTNIDNQASDAEVFLRSEWAQLLSLSEFDAEEVIKRMDEEIKNGFDQYREEYELRWHTFLRDMRYTF